MALGRSGTGVRRTGRVDERGLQVLRAAGRHPAGIHRDGHHRPLPRYRTLQGGETTGRLRDRHPRLGTVLQQSRHVHPRRERPVKLHETPITKEL